tara:strand:- start:292 stop:690 length:399 start_codon:yes stop_codon:yes gene_type:complete
MKLAEKKLLNSRSSLKMPVATANLVKGSDMAQKKLQKDSAHNELDIDGDGIVSDSELAASEVLSQHEKMDAQRQMAWVAMGSMIVFTLAVFLPIFPDARIKALSDLFGLFYIGQAGVVGAYMGMSAWMTKGK